MSRHITFALAVAVFALGFPATAQRNEFAYSGDSYYGPMRFRDAANMEMWGTMRAPERAEGMQNGTVSVTQLTHPLKGKSKKMLAEAERLLAKGEREKSLQLLERAKEDEAAAPWAYSLLGAQHLELGRTEEARQELKTAAGMLPGFAPNFYNLSVALVRLERVEEALIEARKAVQLDPAEPLYRYGIGAMLLYLGRREEAEFQLKKAADDVPGARQLLSQHFGR